MLAQSQLPVLAGEIVNWSYLLNFLSYSFSQKPFPAFFLDQRKIKFRQVFFYFSKVSSFCLSHEGLRSRVRKIPARKVAGPAYISVRLKAIILILTHLSTLTLSTYLCSHCVLPGSLQSEWRHPGHANNTSTRYFGVLQRPLEK